MATTDATVPDSAMTKPIHDTLARRGLLPAEHYVDSGYPSAKLAADAWRDDGIALVSPMLADTSRQARAEAGFAAAAFTIDWDAKQATCPQGKANSSWSPAAQRGAEAIVVKFAASDCRPCPVRDHCTSATRGGRQLTLKPRLLHETLQANRADQDAADWQARYAIRAGVEGTIHQAIAVTGTRNARYKGLPKTHLEHVYAAVALNLIRLHAWWNGHPLDRTRTAISPDQNSRWPRSRELTTRVTVRGKRALSAPGMACTVAAAGAQPYYRAHLVRTQLRATHEFAHPTSTRTGYGSAGIRHARDHATQQTHRRYQRTASTITSGGSRTGEGGPCNGIGGRGEFS